MPSQVTKAVSARYMRRELRDLFEGDRQAFFSALEIVYTVSTADGKSTYGEEYKGADYFIEYHTWMAGTKECDHLHDGEHSARFGAQPASALSPLPSPPCGQAWAS